MENLDLERQLNRQERIQKRRNVFANPQIPATHLSGQAAELITGQRPSPLRAAAPHNLKLLPDEDEEERLARGQQIRIEGERSMAKLRANSELNRKKSRASLKGKQLGPAPIAAEDLVKLAKHAEKALPPPPLFKPLPFWLSTDEKGARVKTIEASGRPKNKHYDTQDTMRTVNMRPIPRAVADPLFVIEKEQPLRPSLESPSRRKL